MVMVFVSALAIRDAAMFEVSRRKCFKKMSPYKFAFWTVLVSVIVVALVMFPLRKCCFGEWSSGKSVHQTIIDVTISVAVLISGLAIRDASIVFFKKSRDCHDRDHEDERSFPWAWAFIVTGSTLALVLLSTKCQNELELSNNGK